MRKILIIIKREYLTRVKKRSFIIMSILGPILMAALFVGPAWLSNVEDSEMKIIAVVDSSKIFTNSLPETDLIKFEYIKNRSITNIENSLKNEKYYAMLYIPPTVLSSPNVVLTSCKQPSMAVRMHISNSLKRDIESLKLLKSNIDPTVIKSIETNVNVNITKINKDGTRESKSADLQMILGIVGGMLIYIFIFMYGAQVMRGVIEEKTSRIIEIIISSVKPFQLMFGKIVGIALVGLTQFILWVVLTMIIVTSVKSFLLPEVNSYNNLQTQSIMDKGNTVDKSNESNNIQYSDVNAVFDTINTINFPVVIGSFIFFFLVGYLLYSAMFAAIGSAVDSEADTQQFMMPVTIPLILSVVLIGNVVGNPEGPIAFWFSIIPFTSPVVMMMRIPFGVPWTEVVLSVTILVASFIFMTWMAGKIYRTGILMYGKKINYKELYKWLRYKNY